ncbi:MAG TPA: LCP family protein, partial [Ktedonobacterales bacterium]|nr:LCP family protein [Ktedonobacterales bacterium]
MMLLPDSQNDLGDTAPMPPDGRPGRQAQTPQPYQPYQPPIPQAMRTAPAQRMSPQRPTPAFQGRLPGARITQPLPPDAETRPMTILTPPGAPPGRPSLPFLRGRGPRLPQRPRWRRIVGIGLLALLLLTLIGGGLLGKRYYDFGVAISPQPPFSSQTNYVSGSGRINIVLFGYGGDNYPGSYLTDSIQVMSLIPSDHATTLISVPRDLWVQVPPGSGQYHKLNDAFSDGFYNGYGSFPAGWQAAGAEGAEKVSEVTGLDVRYWVSLDFNGFRDLVNDIGGIDINVPVGFTAEFPLHNNFQPGDPYKSVTFKAGPQHMNGDLALEYARARYVYDVPSEGTDFARAHRQQLLVKAIMQRLRSPSAWPGLPKATDALQGSIHSNLSLTDLSLFASKMDLQ